MSTNEPTDWTPELVKQRLENCADTLRKLPSETLPGYVNYWPEIKYTPREAMQQEQLPVRLKATPEQITEMEETLCWFDLLNSAGHRKIVWLRAYRFSWRAIARETGYPRTSAQRYWEEAISILRDRLDADER